jgi:hypothetical protein
MICPTGRAKYFWQGEWTVESALIAQVKFDFWRKAFFVIHRAAATGRANARPMTGSRQAWIPRYQSG